MRRVCRHLADSVERIWVPKTQLQPLPIFLSIFQTSMDHQSRPLRETNTINLKILTIQLLSYLAWIFFSLSVACANLVAGEGVSFQSWCAFWVLPDGQIDLSQNLATCTSKRSRSPTCETIYSGSKLVSIEDFQVFRHLFISQVCIILRALNNFLFTERNFTCNVSHLIVQHKIIRRQTNGLNVGIEFCVLLDFDHSNVVEVNLSGVIFMDCNLLDAIVGSCIARLAEVVLAQTDRDLVFFFPENPWKHFNNLICK